MDSDLRDRAADRAYRDHATGDLRVLAGQLGRLMITFPTIPVR